MTPKEKIKNYLTKATSKLSPAGDSWAEWKARATKTGELDFKCDFKEGKCWKAREKPHDTLTTVGCCCTHCKSYNGYLFNIDAQDLDTYLSLWNCRTGFFRKGKGCVLPRELRSQTCLRYNCRNYDFNNALKDYMLGKSNFETITKLR